jgi:hypothetical protein
MWVDLKQRSINHLLIQLGFSEIVTMTGLRDGIYLGCQLLPVLGVLNRGGLFTMHGKKAMTYIMGFTPCYNRAATKPEGLLATSSKQSFFASALPLPLPIT